MTYFVELTQEAENELDAHLLAGNLKIIKKIYHLLSELAIHPKTGTGKPKPLKYGLDGIWSRRIDEKHRMLYKIVDQTITVFVIALWGHYDDK